MAVLQLVFVSGLVEGGALDRLFVKLEVVRGLWSCRHVLILRSGVVYMKTK